jgi:ABC-2 type transport system permease protein
MRRTFAIARKEFIHLRRDPRSLVQVIVMPLMMLLLYGYGIRFDVVNVPLIVWNQDNRADSRDFVERVVASGRFIVKEPARNYADVTRALDDGEARIAIVFSPTFATDLAAGRDAPLQIVVDGTDSNTAAVALGYIQAIAMAWNNGVVRVQPPINVVPRVWYNPELKSTHFVVPGIIAIVLMLIGSMMTAQTITREKQRGTIEQIVVSPVGRYEFIIGKILPYIGLAFFDMLLVILAGYVLFRVPITGSLPLLLGMGAIYLAGILGIGVFASSIAESMETASYIVVLLSLLPSILLSGFVFPIENMPSVVQGLTYLVPARYFLVIIRSIYLKGTGITFFWEQATALVLFDIFIVWVSARRFHKRLG